MANLFIVKDKSIIVSDYQIMYIYEEEDFYNYISELYGNSASAAEIFTGALKDNNRATVVGTTTFGKGIVQSVFELDDGSALKITTERYYTPNGTDIHEHGIEPDVTVELEGGNDYALSSMSEEEDNQLQKAMEILKEK